MAVDKGSPIFENCVFAIVLNRDLDKNVAVQTKATLEDHAGQVAKIGGAIDLTTTTHIISATSDFPEYSDARHYMIPVVRPGWIAASLMKSKQENYRPYTPDPNHIFSDVVLSCGDIPAGDKDAIIGAVLAMGGQENNSLTRMTTHICALTEDHPKCVSAREKNLKCKIVLPHWFDACLKLGKRIDERPYLLPDPEIFRMKPEDSLPFPANENLRGATTTTPESLPIPKDSSRHLTIFQGKKVMISDDLDLGTRTKKVLEDLIESGGGSMTCSVHNADIYVCHWREGRDYVFASRAGIDVGNLSWLYHLIVHNEWTSPLRRLLHYPVPRKPIPGFNSFKITLSNYGGEARLYLENLVIAAGGEFTKSMKQDNTHLITARKSSEKCQAAQEWNIEMVNHLWLEESYAKCAIQKLSDERYNFFPPRTNLGEVIGQTHFNAEILEQIYFPHDPTPSPSDPKPIRRPVMHEKNNNTPLSKKSRKQPNSDVAMADQDDDKEPVTTPREAPSKRRSKSSLLVQVTTPAVRRTSAGKENDTPSTGSRSAKAKAASRIHDLAPDIALYEKEKKRKGAVWGGDRAANKYEKQKSVERSASPGNRASKGEEQEEEGEEEDFSADEEVRPPPKKQKTGPPEIEIRLIATSYKRWLGDINKEDAEKRKLRELGILLTQDLANFTHLAAPNMVRTKKFLCAIASAPVVVSSDFIDACLKDKELPKVNNYLLKDPENEKKFGVKLKDALLRAKANKRHLLRRVPVFCTEKVPNGPDTFKAIVEVNGGTFSVYRGRPTIKKTNPEDDGPAEPVYLLSGESKAEKDLWPKFVEMAQDGNMIPRIVKSEWLLDVAMAQQLKWDDQYLLVKVKNA